MPAANNNYNKYPDSHGYFGAYGGIYLPEVLMDAIQELAVVYEEAKNDSSFREELAFYLDTYAGRPTSLYYAERLTQHLGGAKIYLKREDLAHTGAHKINNAIGQALLARRIGKKRIIAETGAGQHGVATATAAALFGMECEIYMGTEDMKRQEMNVYRMHLLGAKVTAVDAGSRTLKDAINETLRDWSLNVPTTWFLLGSVLGPHPYPVMVRDFQSVIGREAKKQHLDAEGRLPNMLIACVGGGSNSIGLFYEFLGDDDVAMVGVEAGGYGMKLGEHAARFLSGKLGVLHGTKSYVLQNDHGLISETHSVSAGLDYPSVGPEHSMLHEIGRVEYTSASDEEALEAFSLLSHLEGIIPALESAHAVVHAMKIVPKMDKKDTIIVNLSGRGDKDLQIAMKKLL